MEGKVIKRLNRLKEKGVIKDYAIGGAHAVAYYLEPVKTLDLDIFVSQWLDCGLVNQGSVTGCL